MKIVRMDETRQENDLLEEMAANPRSGSYMPPDAETDWKAIAEERRRTIDELCNMAWCEVFGEDHQREWDHPAQAIRHLVQAYQELKRQTVQRAAMTTCVYCLKCRGEMVLRDDKRYHYTECGSRRIWLLGVRLYECRICDEQIVEIPCISPLHELIMKARASSGPPVLFRFSDRHWHEERY